MEVSFTGRLKSHDRFLDLGAVGDENEPGESSKGANKNAKINLQITRMVVDG